MTWLVHLLQQRLGELGSLAAVGGASLLLIAVALAMAVKRRPDPLEKLKAAKSGADAPHSAEARRLREIGEQDKLEKYADYLEPQDEKELSAIRLRLLQAGYRAKSAVRLYFFAQFTLGLGLLALGSAWAALRHATGTIDTRTAIIAVLVPGAIGYLAPRYWVTRRRSARHEEITNGFPDALDMMLVCVEAGQSLDQSILRVAREIRAGYPALSDEFEIVSHEMRAGKERSQVLRDLGERAGVADVASFVTVLIQSSSFGTSVAEALRVYAAEMRDKRVMRAEEKANKLPTKMTLATMVLTVPPLLLILVGPSIYDIARLLTSGEP